MTLSPPGWYPDPGAPPGVAPHVRYWDGSTWTHHVQPVQARPPVATVPFTGPTTPDGERLAGWWWRVLASLLDGIFFGIVSAAATLPVQIDIQRETSTLSDRYFGTPGDPVANPDFAGFWEATTEVYRDHVLGLMVVPLVLGFVYWAGFLRWKGATPGKMICGLRVRLRERPGTLPWSTIVIRMAVQSWITGGFLLVALLSGSLPLLVLGYLALVGFWALDGLWATWNRNRQTLHDIAARTNVVRTR
jgi:uncharacterized RDD family membrane protein YckC